MRRYEVGPGSRFPFGVTAGADGTNFSLWSPDATGAALLLFECAESRTPFQIVALDPVENRTYPFWHVLIRGLPTGVLYAWRVDGPAGGPDTGYRFDGRKALVDPRALAVSDRLWDHFGFTVENVVAKAKGVIAA